MKYFLTFLLLGGGGKLLAQNIYNSPYSIYSFGMVNQKMSTLNRGMGGTGVAVRDGFNLNYQNPASYGSISSPVSSVFEMGFYVEHNNYRTAKLSESKTNGSLKLSQVKKMTVKELHYNKGHQHGVVESSSKQSETLVPHKDLTPSANWLHWDNGKHNMKEDHQDKNKNNENTSFMNNEKSLNQPKKNSTESTKIESFQHSPLLQHQQFFNLQKKNQYKFFPSHSGKDKWLQKKDKGNDQHKQKHAG